MIAELVTDQDLVEVDVAVDVGGEEQLAGAVRSFGDATRGAGPDSEDALAVDHDVGGLAARQSNVLQSPHGRLP
jgi:hypothetical protein